MEENKEKKCCEGKECGNCPMMHGGCHGCGHMGNCHGMRHHVRIIIRIVLIIVVFCLGIQLGELKSEVRGNHFYRGGMMDWNYKVVKPLTNGATPAPTTPAPTTPSVTQ